MWKQKPAKIKKTTLIKKKSDGSLALKDFVLFDKPLKLTWVKRSPVLQLRCTVEGPWKCVPKSSLPTVSGTEFFQCNYGYNLLDLKGHLPEFYKQIIHWQEIVSTTPHSTTPHSKTEILSPTIWNNKFIVTDKKLYICLIGTEQV